MNSGSINRHRVPISAVSTGETFYMRTHGALDRCVGDKVESIAITAPPSVVVNSNHFGRQESENDAFGERRE